MLKKGSFGSFNLGSLSIPSNLALSSAFFETSYSISSPACNSWFRIGQYGASILALQLGQSRKLKTILGPGHFLLTLFKIQSKWKMWPHPVNLTQGAYPKPSV